MKKKRIITLVALILGIIAIVGAGFATWIFTSGSKSSDTQVGIHIEGTKTDLGTFGTSTVMTGTAYYLVFDQDDVYIGSLSNGKYIKEPIEIGWTYTDPNDSPAGNDAVAFYANIFMSEAYYNKLSQYLDFSKLTEGEAVTDRTDMNADEPDMLGMKVFNVELEYTESLTVSPSTAGLSLDLSEYLNYYTTTSGSQIKKPETLDEYKAMLNVLYGNSANISGVSSSPSDDFVIQFVATTKEKN